tara:strand:- start:91 stop:372 length:282 start_codon:yes stop_codon:yes gene_type:complete
MEIKISTLISLIPVLIVGSGAIASFSTLSSDTESNHEDIQENEVRLERHQTQITALDKEVATIKVKVERVEEVTAETKDDVKQVLLILQQRQQ